MKHDAFGDRMKSYEAVETGRRLNPALPVYARMDGRGFSKFTRGLARPFDPWMAAAMIDATRHLIAETHARIGYTQSDEISLVWLAEGEGDIFFSGKVQKLVSVLAGMTTAAFTRAVLESDGGFAAYAERLPHFDARVFQLPSREEAANAFLWREMDASRNAVQMVAQANFSHKTLHGVPTDGLLKMIAEKGIDFDAFPVSFRRGTWLRRVTFERRFTRDELARIPAKHRPPADALVTRSEVREIEMPQFVTVANRVEVVFDGAAPVTAADTPGT